MLAYSINYCQMSIYYVAVIVFVGLLVSPVSDESINDIPGMYINNEHSVELLTVILGQWRSYLFINYNKIQIKFYRYCINIISQQLK